MSSFLIGLLSGLVLATAFFALNWKYVKARLQQSVGQPPPVTEKVVIEIMEQEYNTPYVTGYMFDLPIPWDRMVEVAKRIYSQNYIFNYSITGREAGNPITRGQFDQLRNVLETHTLIREKIPGQRRSGFEFTGPGRAFIRKWADMPPTPELYAMSLKAVPRQAQAHTNENLENEEIASTVWSSRQASGAPPRR
jgi:hypothetical protein